MDSMFIFVARLGTGSHGHWFDVGARLKWPFEELEFLAHWRIFRFQILPHHWKYADSECDDNNMFQTSWDKGSKKLGKLWNAKKNNK